MMKYNYIYMIVLSVFVLLLSGCDRQKFAEQNITNDDLSISCKGNLIIRYDPNKYQIGCNTTTNEYRITDDTMGSYYIIKCSEKPTTKGQSLKADLEYTTADNTVKETNLTFEVQKTDGSGKVWLWNKRKQYGIVIKQL